MLSFGCLPANQVFAAPQKLIVALDWFINPDHAPLIVAEQQGFFKAEGLDVELIGPADPNDPPKWVAANKADVALTYQPEFLQQVDHGLPLIMIGTLIDQPLNCLLALKESGIQSIQDFKGKHIGSINGGLSSMMLKVILQKNGLSTNDVDLIHVRYNLTQSLLSHNVDIVSGLMRNIEIPQLEMEGKQVTAFFPENYGIPTYSELILVTNTKLRADPRFPRFLRALKKGIRYYQAHLEETWQSFKEAHPESANEINHRIWNATATYFARDPVKFDAISWQHFAAFMLEHQLIKKIAPLSRYAAYHHPEQKS